MTSHVEQQVQARIAAARQRTEDMRRQRAELAAARRRGLAARHEQKLRSLRGAEDHAGMGQSTTDEERGTQSVGTPGGDLASGGNRGDTDTVGRSQQNPATVTETVTTGSVGTTDASVTEADQ
jgi:hypothetical protein